MSAIFWLRANGFLGNRNASESRIHAFSMNPFSSTFCCLNDLNDLFLKSLVFNFKYVKKKGEQK